ncbi:MAG: aminoglycoside phosphotransferase family protein [Candidatus Kerfeldbacteria bacterium]|nr:aminoglycoside phosphotransferase family protein [Candidatus Kerfeldbacteria bacterium]
MRTSRRWFAANDRRALGRVWQTIVRRYYPAGARLIRFSTADVGRYRFKRSLLCTLHLRLPNGSRSIVRLRGNLPSQDTPGEIKIADAVQKRLWKMGFRAGPLRVPRTLGHFPSVGMNFYEDFPGRNLKDLAKRRDQRSLGLARRAGNWLGQLHRATLQVGPRRTAKRIRLERDFFLDDFSRFAPAATGRALRVLDSAVQSQIDILRHGRWQPCTIHGDLNLSNIILGQDQSIGFIDFGTSTVFDPLNDIGNFLAQVDILVWSGKVAHSQGKKLQQELLDGYVKVTGRPAMNRTRIDLHRAWWTIQILAYTLSTKTSIGRHIAERALTSATSLLRRRSFAPVDSLTDQPLGLLRPALINHTAMTAYFTDHLAGFFQGSNKVERLTIEQPHALSARSFLTRYVLLLRRQTGGADRRVVRGNFWDRRTYEILRSVYRHPRRTFKTMHPLQYENKFGYVFYEELDGPSLRLAKFRSPSFAAVISGTARALQNLHSLVFRKVRMLSWQDERQFLQLVLAGIRQHDRRLIPNLDSIIYSLKRAAKPIWNNYRVLVHNDFQASNIIASSPIGIIDYTRSGLGHPMIDVGNFLAHLRIMLAGILPRHRIEKLADLFLRTYLGRASSHQRQSLLRVLPLFELRSCLEILAVTLTNLPRASRGRKFYQALLKMNIASLVRKAGIL